MEKERKIVKSFVIELPLILFGCKYVEKLHINIYDNDDVSIFMPVSLENLKVVPKDLNTSRQGVLNFELNEENPYKEYHCTTLGYDVCIEKSIDL